MSSHALSRFPLRARLIALFPLVVAASATASPLFTAPFLSFEAGHGPVALALRDLNADGDSDLVVVNGSANSISVLLGDDTGGFAGHVDYPTGRGPDPPTTSACSSAMDRADSVTGGMSTRRGTRCAWRSPI